MRLATAADREHIEALCNAPEMRVWSAFDGAPLWQMPAPPSFAVVGEEGCLLADHVEGQRFAVHATLLAHCRGARAVQACREGLAIAFTHTGAQELMAPVPRSIPQSRWLAWQLGFQYVLTTPPLWRVDGHVFPADVFRLTRQEWLAANRIEEGRFQPENRDAHSIRSHRHLPV